MKSLCIKESHNEVIDFINNALLKLDLDSVYVTNKQFNVYKNIILHYNGDALDIFYDKISAILTDAIIYFYEKRLIKRILEYNYFYFDSTEKREIVDVAEEFIADDIISTDGNYFSVYSPISDYIKNNKSIVLEGFVNFRLSNYIKNLDYAVDIAVNKYVTDKEYLEFVNMLKLYVSFTKPNVSVVHLIYFRRRKYFIR